LSNPNKGAVDLIPALELASLTLELNITSRALSTITLQANFLWKITFDTLYVRATGAQDSRRILSYITVCGYDTTHLQENPQRLG